MSERIRWARKVSQAVIRQLYRTDALGIVDEELVDEVGTALYARCQSILLVSCAQVICPRCGRLLQLERGRPEETPLCCPEDGCTWQSTYGEWHRSWRHQDLIGTRAIDAFESYVERYWKCKGPRAKMLLIDELIHAFHQGIVEGMPHRSAANNLIEGSHSQVLAFLDEFAFGDQSTPGVAEAQAKWREKVQQVQRVRRGG